MAKRTTQRPMPVLAVVRNLDPRICGCCSYAHGTPGTRCERHGKYIDRLPTEEERTDADRQAEANKDPAVALPKILELLKLDTDDIDNLGGYSFDVVRAFGVWDHAHVTAFLKWCANPWRP